MYQALGAVKQDGTELMLWHCHFSVYPLRVSRSKSALQQSLTFHGTSHGYSQQRHDTAEKRYCHVCLVGKSTSPKIQESGQRSLPVPPVAPPTPCVKSPHVGDFAELDVPLVVVHNVVAVTIFTCLP